VGKRVFVCFLLLLMIAVVVDVVRGNEAWGQSDCEFGAVCLYEDSGFFGLVAQFLENMDVSYVGDDANDRISSVHNNTSSAVVLYDDPNYGGTEFCLDPGIAIDDLSVVGLDDSISSLAFSGSC
jgi:hypothetical protein